MRADLAGSVALELERLAREEPPAANPLTAPVHADRYRSLLASTGGAEAPRVQVDGPAFSFPEATAGSPDVALIEDERRLERHFRGWVPGEIAAGRAPVLAVVEHGEPVSICFCARRSEIAAEAGLETAEAFRGRGFGTRVTSAWAAALRATGRTPLYSTSWTNHASLAVARKLGLVAYACHWSLVD